MPEKVYGPKPAEGQVQRELDRVHPIPELPEQAPPAAADRRRDALRARGRLKAQRLAEVHQGNGAPVRFSRDGIDYSVTGFRFDPAHGYVECQVQATKDGEALPVDNPYRFINPPILLATGTWRKEPGPDGEDLNVRNFVEDLPGVWEQIIADSVVAVARGLGWRP